jgi:hypothetical protein
MYINHFIPKSSPRREGFLIDYIKLNGTIMRQKIARVHKRTQKIIKRRNVTFEVFTAVAMKNGVFWDIKPSSYFTGDTLHLRYRVQQVNPM